MVKKDLLGIEENPLPLWYLAISMCVSIQKKPLVYGGNALAYFIGDNQRIKTGITRGFLDNMSESNNAQKFYTKRSIGLCELEKDDKWT